MRFRGEFDQPNEKVVNLAEFTVLKESLFDRNLTRLEKAFKAYVVDPCNAVRRKIRRIQESFKNYKIISSEFSKYIAVNWPQIEAGQLSRERIDEEMEVRLNDTFRHLARKDPKRIYAYTAVASFGYANFVNRNWVEGTLQNDLPWLKVGLARKFREKADSLSRQAFDQCRDCRADEIEVEIVHPKLKV